MFDTTRGTHRRRVTERLRAGLSGRLAFVVAVSILLSLVWGVALWIIHYTYAERETSALQLVNDEARNAEQKLDSVFGNADRTLVELRTLFPEDNLPAALEHRPPSRNSEEIALIAPDGTVLGSTPGANTAGWPHLMAELANADDVPIVGEPVLNRSGHLGYLPLARRVVRPDGSFGGILMFSIGSQAFPDLSSAVTELDGCASLVNDDGVVIARIPDVRGTIGIRMTQTAELPGMRRDRVGMGRHTSPIDGIDRIFAFHRLDAIPATVIAGIGYDVTFAEWETVQLMVIVTRAVASLLILLTFYLWYTRRRRARISAGALTAILGGVDHGIRVLGAGGEVLAANPAGTALRMPDGSASRVEIQQPDGATLRIERHEVAEGGTVLISTDVTARRAHEARIDFLTNHDPLTGLPNRWRAASRIQELIAEKSLVARMAALILVDLDGFQDINDTLGHEGGDEVLTEVALRLRDLVAEHDVVARLGGDEFLLFLDDPDDEDAIMSLARQIPRTLARPIAVRGQQIRLGASMGIALYPRDGPDVTTLFRHADIALSRAKMAGRGTAQSFDPEMMVSFEEHRMMESDLRRALDSDELELRLQPQFSCATLEVSGFEALARWRHPTRGDLSPAMFIPIAERSGLINPLGLWAIEQACRAAAGWSARHRIAVNLSPLQLRCETIQDDIRGILRRTQFPAHLLELEVTESVLLDKDRRTLETLHKLRAMDIRITLDDFGTGYSSLSYLRRFPFDKIKIDKSFIQTQGTDRGTRVILEAMIRMCTDLGFDVVAEGVETEHQLAELRQLGCRELQGFLLGEPLRPEMVDDFLASHGRRCEAAPDRNVEPAPT